MKIILKGGPFDSKILDVSEYRYCFLFKELISINTPTIFVGPFKPGVLYRYVDTAEKDENKRWIYKYEGEI